MATTKKRTPAKPKRRKPAEGTGGLAIRGLGLPPRLAEGPQRAPFSKIGCAAHTHGRRQGGERPGFSERHHVFPLGLQARVWPGVNRSEVATIRDREVVGLCGNGHTDVHGAIDALLGGKRVPPGVGPIERALAREAVSRYKSALAFTGGGSPTEASAGASTGTLDPVVVDLPENTD